MLNVNVVVVVYRMVGLLDLNILNSGVYNIMLVRIVGIVVIKIRVYNIYFSLW